MKTKHEIISDFDAIATGMAATKTNGNSQINTLTELRSISNACTVTRSWASSLLVPFVFSPC